MKRELAFALEARSQFSCFIGRTRSSKSPPPQFIKRKTEERSSSDLSKISIDEVNMSRRSKRVKTAIPDSDSINVDRSKGDEESPKWEAPKGEEESTATEVAKTEEVSDTPEATMGEEVPAAPEVAMAEEESPAAEAAKEKEQSAALEAPKSEEKGTRTVEKVYVSRKYKKDRANSSSPKRFTRSALKEKEDLGTPTRKKLELKMSKKIGLGRMPTNMRELLETGLLEGFQVFYNLEDKKLKGVIKGAGILCSCKLCMDTKVVSPSQFELHACEQYRHAIKHICLENGKSLLEVLEICKSSAMEPLEVALQTVISSLPLKEPSISTERKGPIQTSSTENIKKDETSCTENIKKDETSSTQNIEKDEISSSENIKKDETFSTEDLEEDDTFLIPKQILGLPAINVENGEKSPVLKVITNTEFKAITNTEIKEITNTELDAITNTELPNLSEKKRGRGRPRKSDSVLNTPKCGTNGKSSRNKIKAKIVRKYRSQKSTPSALSSQQKSGKKLTIKNQQLHWPVFEDGGLPDGTELTYVSHGKKLLDGYKLGHGIFCSCCNTEISASQFEAHAGWATRKKPYENIYISNGVSLHEYAVTLKRAENRRNPAKFNDDLCRICWDGGNLLLCDGCPRSFHQECADEPNIPHGKWYCKYCLQAMKFDGDCENAVVAGRIEGIDPIEQITKRCIRIVKTPENIDLVACVLCRGHDFSRNVFNDRTVIVCDQCEREYHIGCLREQKMADLEALPKGKWFCRTDCERIHSVLQNLLTCEPETVHDDLLTFVREKQKNKEEDDKDKDKDKNVISQMKFILLSGKNATRETRPLLTQTIDIFHEGFDPIIDATSGRDFIPSMVYGRKIWSQDFAGMLCAILTIESNVVSAGTLRVFGQDIAELPIVATSKTNQGKGYFHVLFSCIERLLSSLNIKKIVLPAADEAKSIWTKLGFQTIEPEELGDLRQRCSAMMTFKGTSMLQKDIIIQQAQNSGDVEVVDVVEVVEVVGGGE